MAVKNKCGERWDHTGEDPSVERDREKYVAGPGVPHHFEDISAEEVGYAGQRRFHTQFRGRGEQHLIVQGRWRDPKIELFKQSEESRRIQLDIKFIININYSAKGTNSKQVLQKKESK